jgi:predicted DNA-binding transcriptional regulator AlpA
MDESSPTLTIKAVASALKVHPKTVRRLIARKLFPEGVKIGSSPRWYLRDCQAYTWLRTRGLLGEEEPGEEISG